MLELSKKILAKVSFDRKLFRKELKKAVQWVRPDELIALRTWCQIQFGHLYADLIIDVFDRNISPA